MPGIYIHIPFCKQACHYCDFHFSTTLHKKDDFLKALLLEIELRSDYLNRDEEIETVYFGGGTPSLLEKRELDIIFNQLNKYYPISAKAEITLEANPDDLSTLKLEEIRKTQVNRLSIGIQSFRNEELKWMNRAHDATMAINCVREAQEQGFKNISVDLIYGSPLLTDELWIENLEKVFSLDVQHLSCYNLTVETKTALASFIKTGKRPAPDENLAAGQFKILMEMTSGHGFEQYEISNFCRNDQYSRHNSNYWKGAKYIGFGPSAHSYNGLSRQWNKANNVLYINEISKGIVPFEVEVLSKNDIYNEYIMTSLRTKWGVNRSELLEKTSKMHLDYFLSRAEKYIYERQMEQWSDHFILTTAGKYFADRIASDLFYLEKSAV